MKEKSLGELRRLAVDEARRFALKYMVYDIAHFGNFNEWNTFFLENILVGDSFTYYMSKRERRRVTRRAKKMGLPIILSYRKVYQGNEVYLIAIDFNPQEYREWVIYECLLYKIISELGIKIATINYLKEYSEGAKKND